MFSYDRMNEEKYLPDDELRGMLRMRKGTRVWSRFNLFKGTALPPESRLSKDAVTALIIHCCFQFGASMSGLFLNLYLWRLTQDLAVNGIYNIIVFILTPPAFALGAGSLNGVIEWLRIASAS